MHSEGEGPEQTVQNGLQATVRRKRIPVHVFSSSQKP